MGKKYFSFGRNWKNYVKNVVNEKVLEEARRSLTKYLKEEEFQGKHLIDVGCGSGLFSLASQNLGCSRITSFDLDEYSIEALELLKTKFNINANNWEHFSGSILDNDLVTKYKEQGDIVYSWGVLHHTGNMWQAIENATQLVKPNGHLIIAIYNHSTSSNFWKKIKLLYNNFAILRPLLIAIFGSYETVVFYLRNKTLYRERGMHIFYDAIDWLGGYPYEFACHDEVKQFVENIGFKLVKAPLVFDCYKSEINKIGIFGKIRMKNNGCNEFVFQKVN